MGMEQIAKATADALEAAQEALDAQQQKIASLEASLSTRKDVDPAKIEQVVDGLIAKGLYKEADRKTVTEELSNPDGLAQKCADVVAKLPGAGRPVGAHRYGRGAQNSQGKLVKKSDEVWSSHFG